METLKVLDPENTFGEERFEFMERTAVRGVVFDAEGNIGLLRVTGKNYHKLPGGGVEPGEDNEIALRRECREELGCDIRITGEVGLVVEYRRMQHLAQYSPCYAAEVVGEKGSPFFTQEEKDEGFEVLWLQPAEAVKLLNSDRPTDDEARLYIVPREQVFLRQVLEEEGKFSAPAA